MTPPNNKLWPGYQAHVIEAISKDGFPFELCRDMGIPENLVSNGAKFSIRTCYECGVTKDKAIVVVKSVLIDFAKTSQIFIDIPGGHA